MNKLLALVLLALLASCHPQPDPVVVARDAALAQASRDSARAVQLHATAQRLYAQGRAAEDSATLYYTQSHALTPAIPVDTTALRQFFADYPR